MEFVKEFATFLHQKGAIKFGDFTLASGNKSSYYIDLRLVPSFPHIYRKMIKQLEKSISEEIGFENFDSVASVPTGGLVMASALAFEIVKPLIYVRNKPKDYGTSKSVEGHVSDGLRVLMIDDVATTGGSVVKGIQQLKEAGTVVKDVFVIVNRMQGAEKLLSQEGAKLHQLTNILEITQALHEENLVGQDILETVKNQVSN